MPENMHSIAVGVCEDKVTLTVDDTIVHIPWKGAMEIGAILIASAIAMAHEAGVSEPGIQAAMDQTGAMVEALVSDE